jgi:mono/diheme cytochrome c family protein
MPPTAHGRGLFLVLAFSWVTSAAAASSDGLQLYRTHCAGCHGRSGAGNGPDAKLFSPAPRDLRTGFLGKYTTEDLAHRVLDGRALQLAFDLPALKARAKEAESVAVYLTKLPDVDWSRVDAGEAVYARRCEDCHNRYGEPVQAPPPGVRQPRDLSDPDFQRSISDDELMVTVGHGREGMPGLVPRLTDSEARQVVSYVRLLSPGHKTYTQYCANCHGADGRGAGSFGEARTLPTIAFDREYFRRASGDGVRDQVWHMLAQHGPSMPHFRETLSNEQARSIAEYLRTLEVSP